MARSSAERSRDYRARRRDARDAEQRAARAEAERLAPKTMRDAVEVSLAAMKWLVASDGGVVQQARALAHAIDIAEFLGDDRMLLAAHGKFTTVLRQLGGTPDVRMRHELRAGRIAAPGDAQMPGNVTTLRRPPKRQS